MSKTSLLIEILIIVLLLSPSATAIFASSYDIKGTFTKDTKAFFIGKTTIMGTFTGISMNHWINSSVVQDMGGFPLIGASSIPNVDTLIVVENIDITTATSLENLSEQFADRITTYSNVELTTDNGLFLLGIHEGNLTVSTDVAYAVTSFLLLEVIPDTTTRFFFVGTNYPLSMDCTGDFSVLTLFSDTGTIMVRDQTGRILWTSSSPNDYLFIQDTSFTVTHHAPLVLFPLDSTTSTAALRLSLSPAESKNVKMKQLIRSISVSVENLGDNTTSEFIKNINEVDTLVQATSFIPNGAIVLLQINETMTIDRSSQRFSSVGFTRFKSLDITKVGSSTGPVIEGTCALCFLGDHFYNPQAKRSPNGIAFPFELLIIWILALGAFIYVRFFLRPPIDMKKDERIRRYALYIHLIVLIVAFLLLDIEVNDLIGISALTALLSQGFTIITGTFLLLELVIWVLVFFILALPLQLLSYSILRFFGYGKGANGIRKAVGDLSIWVFSGLYLLLFLNVIFSLIDFQSVFPMG